MPLAPDAKLLMCDITDVHSPFAPRCIVDINQTYKMFFVKGLGRGAGGLTKVRGLLL